MELNEKNDAYWKLGVFYYNKDDKRIFPPKRNPMLGWTINFANPYALIILTLFVVVLLMVGIYMKP